MNKTLALRILRPLYPPNVEEQIKSEKTAQKNKKLPPQFWKDLKKKHPEIVSLPELFDCFQEMQKKLTAIYNRSISNLYIRIITNAEEVRTEKALSEGPYKEASAEFPSYVALGLRQKIQSNFRIKELKRFAVSLPTAKSDTFPITFYKQDRGSTGCFKIQEQDEDFVIEIPLPRFEYDGKKIEFAPPRKTKKTLQHDPIKVPVILSTKRRRERGNWEEDEGTNAEIRRVMQGVYRVRWAEITRRKRFGRPGPWFVHLTIKYDKETTGLSSKIVGGIDLGVSNAMVCAVNNSLNRITVRGNDVVAFNRKTMARRRQLQKASAHRTGHGVKSKLCHVTALTEKAENYRKKTIERWTGQVADFFIKEKAGLVRMEDLEGIKNREEALFLRQFWPYGKIQTHIKQKLEENGIKVELVRAKDTSKKCHSCGHINDGFTFEYRKQNKFPEFKCDSCGVKCPADYNAARNILAVSHT